MRRPAFKLLLLTTLLLLGYVTFSGAKKINSASNSTAASPTEINVLTQEINGICPNQWSFSDYTVNQCFERGTEINFNRKGKQVKSIAQSGAKLIAARAFQIQNAIILVAQEGNNDADYGLSFYELNGDTVKILGNVDIELAADSGQHLISKLVVKKFGNGLDFIANVPTTRVVGLVETKVKFQTIRVTKDGAKLL